MRFVRPPLPAVLAILLAISILPASAKADFKKTKIAVLDFQLQGEEFPSKDMGKIVAEWLITGLVETGRFDVIERRLLEKILAEQNLGMSGAIDPDSAAQLGKVLGVKTIVSGTLTNLEGMNEINARLINVDTASIVAAEKVQADSAEGLRDLVSRITDRIAMAFPLEGYIVQRTGAKVTIDLGRSLGVKPGMKFLVYKEGKVIKHPKTGEVLDIETIETGLIEIQTTREKTSSGVILQETSRDSVAYGNLVRSTSRENLGDRTSHEEQQPSGERRGLIPIPRFFRRE